MKKIEMVVNRIFDLFISFVFYFGIAIILVKLINYFGITIILMKLIKEELYFEIIIFLIIIYSSIFWRLKCQKCL